jgi:hypothetical protein
MLQDYPKLSQKLKINHTRNKQQDHTALLDEAAAKFCYDDWCNCYWQSEEYSLLYGTPLWEQASASQRLVLNHLYWVAYYAQIVSAEIATIYFNQTSAAGLYALEDFRSVCDMLDLESTQERAHINAFRTVAQQIEQALFGRSLFTYAMRGPFTETMVFANTNALKEKWKKLQLYAFGLLSSDNAFLACQYFTVRGLRTLNGKLVQHKLSHFHQHIPDIEQSPIPTRISYYHFMDESFHFNSSTILSHDVVKCLKPPTVFEQWVMNLGIWGCQQDHYHFSVAINGIFWYDPALYLTIYQVLRSPQFDFSDQDAKTMLHRCFTAESEGLHRSFQTHQEACASYQAYLDKLDYIWPNNRTMSLMASNSIEKYLHRQRQACDRQISSLLPTVT